MQPTQPPPALEPPPAKRTIAFFDGQNLFHAAQEAFHYNEPNYDPLALARRLCANNGWRLEQVRFYTGVPVQEEDPHWHNYWTAKLQGLRNAKVEVFERPLRYRRKKVRLPLVMAARHRAQFLLPDGTYLTPGTKLYLPNGDALPDGTEVSVRVGEEKGIDIRLALDLIRLTRERAFDVGLVFSQDQDLAEAAQEAFTIARELGHPLQLCSAFPEGSQNQVGIRFMKPIKIDGATYAACLDPRNYHRPESRRRHRR